MSRRIQLLGLGQHRLAQQRVQAAHRQQVDRAAEKLAQLVGELLDLPAQPVPGLEGVKNVEVAVGRAVPPMVIVCGVRAARCCVRG